MARIFSFERELHATLSFVPLAVRRKLDLAGRKISLEGWRALAMEDRRALADARIDDDAAARAFAEALGEAATRAGVSLQPIAAGDPHPWRGASVPEKLREKLAEDAWLGLDDETRYVLLKLAEAQREPWRLNAALAELGLLDPPR
jgi:hypothetical protein